MRRVVITGLGIVSPLGCGVEATWKRLIGGESGIRSITEFDTSDLSCKIAAFIPRGDYAGRCVRSERMDGAQGTAQGRRLHHFRDGGGRAGA